MKRGLFSRSNDQLPWQRAMIWILMSVLIVTGSVTISILTYKSLILIRSQNPHYHLKNIDAFLMEGHYSLPTDFFAKELGLAGEQPINFYEFSTQYSKEKLENHPLILKAQVFLESPDTVQIHYQPRTPLAKWGNGRSAGIDQEGMIIPLHFHPEEHSFPQVFTQIQSAKWGDKLSKSDWKIAKHFLDHAGPLLQSEGIRMISLDLSRLETPEYGRREVLLGVELPGTEKKSLIRLPTEGYIDRLNDFIVLANHNPQLSSVVDLRIKGLALLKLGANTHD